MLGFVPHPTYKCGNIVNQYAYDAFGRVISQTQTISNPFKYVGRFGVMDEGNGLLYMRARYYDPAIGRFINKDPIGLKGGINMYAYVGNNPVNLKDPSGLDYLSCLASCITMYDPFNPASEIVLSALGGTFPKSWLGLPRGLGSASRCTTVPSAGAFFTGGGASGTVGAVARGVGRVFMPIWVGYGVYLFGMEMYCAIACAQDS